MSWVYFISNGEHVKIGVAENPFSRLKRLQTASAAQLTLEAFVPGVAEDERRLHKRFERYRVHGEWFERTGSLDDVISAAKVLVREFPTWNDPSSENALPKVRARDIEKMFGENTILLRAWKEVSCMSARKYRQELSYLVSAPFDTTGDEIAYGVKAATRHAVPSHKYVIGAIYRGREAGYLR
jgi:hypothetical protein